MFDTPDLGCSRTLVCVSLCDVQVGMDVSVRCHQFQHEMTMTKILNSRASKQDKPKGDVNNPSGNRPVRFKYSGIYVQYLKALLGTQMPLLYSHTALYCMHFNHLLLAL